MTGHSRSAIVELSPAALAASADLRMFVGDRKFGTILADPPWQFQNRTGKVAPEHERLSLSERGRRLKGGVVSFRANADHKNGILASAANHRRLAKA